jgi:CP family cyanate transporter-like MFS transporter
VLAWLPSIYRDNGYSPVAAGFLLSIAGLAQLPATLALPVIAGRASNQVGYLMAATVLIAAGIAGVLLAPTAAAPLWAALIGIGQGSTFALGLSLFVLRAHGVPASAQLSAMAQSVGYVLAALGPLAVGLVFDLTNAWTVPLTLLLLLLVPQLVAGALAGRRRWVDAAAGDQPTASALAGSGGDLRGMPPRPPG